MSDGPVSLAIPSRPTHLALVRLVVGATAALVSDLDEGRIGDLRLVVSEMCTNAMEANWRAAAAVLGQQEGAGRAGATRAGLQLDAALLDAAGLVHIMCRAHRRGVEVIVRDHGQGFVPSDDAPHPPAHDPTRLDHERGLGIPLVQYLADEVTFTSAPTGTSVSALVLPR